MHPRLLLLSLLVPMLACSDQTLSTAPNASLPRFDIADAARNYKAGFYWLPPMVRQPNAAGTFDASLSPTVEICELAGDACGAIIATYTTTSERGGEYIRIQDDQQYHVNWHTDEFALNDASVYRISVRAGDNDVLLGYADVQPVADQVPHRDGRRRQHRCRAARGDTRPGRHATVLGDRPRPAWQHHQRRRGLEQLG
jgi:hypothetical protein